MNIIEVDNLTKRYGELAAADHVSFTVQKGTMLGFLGVNGAGKTTVINMLATLIKPDEGSAKICGETLGRDDSLIRRKIGIVYQQNCLDGILSVQENLMCRGMLHGASKKEAKEQCTRLSEILKLGDILKKRYQTLSGGQKRRCEIAAALMHTPQILFLDEPTTGLDPATRLDVWNTVKELQKKENMTVFLTTHYMEEAAAAQKIIILDHGRIITSGTPFTLKQRFASDKLKLYCKEGKRQEVLRLLERFLEKKTGGHGNILELSVASTMDALPVIERAKEQIDGFEVILGNMDDVFLNATGRELTDDTQQDITGAAVGGWKTVEDVTKTGRRRKTVEDAAKTGRGQKTVEDVTAASCMERQDSGQEGKQV